MRTCQKLKILKVLQRRGYITRYTAKGMGVSNLRARVCELRKDGWRIETEAVERFRWVGAKGQRHLQAYWAARYVLRE